MAKGKHKRKKQHNQKTAQQGATCAVIMEKKEIAKNETTPGPEGTRKPRNNENPSRWRRFKEWVKGNSSFTDWWIAAFTSVLSAAAIYQFIIMGGQLDVMRKDLRAWITVTTKSGKRGKLIDIVDNVPTASVTIANTGKTPATNIAAIFYIEVVPNGDAPHFEAKTMYGLTFTTGVMVPNAPQENSIAMTRQKGEGGQPLSDVDKASLANGKSWEAVHGILYYYDIFKQRHWVRFCFWDSEMVGKYISKDCTDYNSVDED